MTFQRIEDSMKSEERVESQEQRNAVKPIVVSRRRLLRAGAASVPVILTMAGVAPGQFGGQASAASGMNYDRKGTVARFSSIHNDVLRDGLIYSDQNGFIVRKDGTGYYVFNGVNNTSIATDPTANTTITLNRTTSNTGPSSITATITATLDFSNTFLNYVSRLNKNGSYYTQAKEGDGRSYGFKFDLTSTPISLDVTALTDSGVEGSDTSFSDIKVSDLTITPTEGFTASSGSWYALDDNTLTVSCGFKVTCTCTISATVTNTDSTVDTYSVSATSVTIDFTSVPGISLSVPTKTFDKW